MNIYESLEKVLSPEELNTFKHDVEKSITVVVGEKLVQEQKKLEAKAEEYVSLSIEEKTKELEVKAEEFVEIRIQEEKDLLVKEYDEKLEELETTVVESLDRFLDNEISEKISDELLEDVAMNQALLPLAEGMKKLLEDHYVAADTEGTAKIIKLQDEKNALEENLSAEIAKTMEYSELAEKAATELLVREKTEDLTISESNKVKTFFEGKSFDEVSEKIDSYVGIVTEETQGTTDKDIETIEETVADDDGIVEKRDVINENKAETDLFALADRFLT